MKVQIILIISCFACQSFAGSPSYPQSTTPEPTSTTTTAIPTTISPTIDRPRPAVLCNFCQNIWSSGLEPTESACFPAGSAKHIIVVVFKNQSRRVVGGCRGELPTGPMSDLLESFNVEPIFEG